VDPPGRKPTAPHRPPIAQRGPGDVLTGPRLAVLLASLILLFQVGGLLSFVKRPPSGPDYLAATEYVEQRHKPGELIVSAIPPPVYLVRQTMDDLVFLPGPLDGVRAQRYTRLTGQGEFSDYWLGVPSIVSVTALCDTIAGNPDLWLVVDESRLNESIAYQGPMAEVIRGTTMIVFAGDGGVEVRRPVSTEAWDDLSRSHCAQPTSTTGA